MGFKLGREAGKDYAIHFAKCLWRKNDKPPVELIAESTVVALDRASCLLALDSTRQRWLGECLICLNILVDAI